MVATLTGIAAVATKYRSRPAPLCGLAGLCVGHVTRGLFERKLRLHGRLPWRCAADQRSRLLPLDRMALILLRTASPNAAGIC